MTEQDILQLREDINSIDLMKIMEAKAAGEKNSEEVWKFKSIKERINMI